LNGVPEIDTSVFKLGQKSLRRVVSYYSYIIPESEEYYLVVELFSFLHDALVKLLTQVLLFFGPVRVGFKLHIDWFESCSSIIVRDKVTGSDFFLLTNENFIETVLVNAQSVLIDFINLHNESGSEWSVIKISRLDVLIGEFKSKPGLGYIPLPSSMKGRKGLVNIRTRPCHSCFQLCLFAYEHYNEIYDSVKGFKRSSEKLLTRLRNPDTYNPYYNSSRFDFTGLNLNTGVPLNEIRSIFETRNPTISVAVYGLDGSDPYPILLPEELRDEQIFLLWLEDSSSGHYVWIKSMSSFLYTRRTMNKTFCKLCMKRYKSEETLKSHICGKLGQIEYSAPKKSGFRFEQLSATMRIPFVIVLEVLTLDELVGDGIYERFPIACSTVAINEHSVAFHRQAYVGHDCLDIMLMWLNTAVLELLQNIESVNLKAEPTPEELDTHRSKTNCDFCGVQFGGKKVATFDHLHRENDSSGTGPGRYPYIPLIECVIKQIKTLFLLIDIVPVCARAATSTKSWRNLSQ